MYGLMNYRATFRALPLIIGLVAVVLVFSVVAFGEGIELFPQSDEGVSLFESPLELFPIEQPTAMELPEIELLLFESPKIDVKIEQLLADDFGRNHDEETSRRKRPVMYCYGPTWCQPCDRNFRKIGSGDRRIEVRCIKGDESTFPACVRDHGAANGWPVQYWATPKGTGALHHGVKSLDELVEFVRLEPGETPSVPTPRRAFVSTASLKE